MQLKSFIALQTILYKIEQNRPRKIFRSLKKKSRLTEREHRKKHRRSVRPNTRVNTKNSRKGKNVLITVPVIVTVASHELSPNLLVATHL